MNGKRFTTIKGNFDIFLILYNIDEKRQIIAHACSDIDMAKEYIALQVLKGKCKEDYEIIQTKCNKKVIVD